MAGTPSPQRPILLAALALATVVVLVMGALGTGIIKLPGAPSGPIESPPPIDHLATPITGALTLGDSLSVQAIQLGADGSSTTVSAPGQPWDGLKIDIPAGAWPGATLQVSAQPITGSTFGDLVTPISPLYTVSGADGMAPLPVTLKIPAVIPDDSFAMGFFYDGSGHLEGMPLLAEDGTSVTVATEHFSSWFASLVKKALLPRMVDSGFRPGVDDWQFANYGSFITPRYNCAGQVLTEAWYFIERRLKSGAAPLHGLYDNNGSIRTPDLWQDDSDGYRLASVAQRQYLAYTQSGADTSKLDDFFYSWRGVGFDALQYDAFRYAIAITGEPQLVSISDAQNANGHAMLVWLVTPGGLYVADPNYPAALAATRLIPFDVVTGKFGTYSSGANSLAIAQGNQVSYKNFVYKAKTALVDWPSLSADWAAFDAGTIGNGVFPAYALQALAKDAQGGDVWVPLVDGYRTPEKQMTVRMLDPNGADYMLIQTYHGLDSEYERSVSSKSPVIQIDLEDGDNSVGIYEAGGTPASPDELVTTRYVDFVRLNVILEPAESPSPTTGGQWVLTDIRPMYGGAARSWHNDFESLAVDSTDGKITATWDTEGPPKVHVETFVSWGSPPQSAPPGYSWITALKAEATVCRGDGVNLDFAYSSLSAHVDWYAGAQDPRHDEWSVSVTCSQAKASTTVSWGFPVFHGAGLDSFGILVTGAGYTEDTWTYYYQWQP